MTVPGKVAEDCAVEELTVPTEDTAKAEVADLRAIDRALPFLTAADREALLLRASGAVYAQGDVVIEEGAQARSLFIVRQGLVRVERSFLARGVAVAHLGPGDMFGEMSLLEGIPASATVVAENDVRLDVIKGSDLRSLLASVPGLGARFYQSLATTLSQRLRATSALIPPLMVEEVPQVNRFHAQRTGHLDDGEIPADLVEIVEDFKTVMLETDRKLKNRRIKDEDAQARVSGACSSVNAALRYHVECSPEIERGIGAYVFRETFSYFMLSRFLDRAFTKPRGYAGDCETMDMVNANQAEGDGRLGRFVDRWALSLPAVQAMKSRRSFLCDTIRELAAAFESTEPMAVTSLASGAGREVFDVLAAPNRPDLRVLCVDMDPEALLQASRLAEQAGVTHQVTFAQDNLVHLSQGRGKIRVSPQWLIYSVGLIDYLPDEFVVSLLDWIYDVLLPGGTVVLGSFDQSDPDKAFLDHVVEWQLVRRSAEQLHHLFAESRFGDRPVEVKSNQSAIQLYAFCRKPF